MWCVPTLVPTQDWVCLVVCPNHGGPLLPAWQVTILSVSTTNDVRTILWAIVSLNIRCCPKGSQQQKGGAPENTNPKKRLNKILPAFSSKLTTKRHAWAYGSLKARAETLEPRHPPTAQFPNPGDRSGGLAGVFTLGEISQDQGITQLPRDPGLWCIGLFCDVEVGDLAQVVRMHCSCVFVTVSELLSGVLYMDCCN